MSYAATQTTNQSRNAIARRVPVTIAGTSVAMRDAMRREGIAATTVTAIGATTEGVADAARRAHGMTIEGHRVDTMIVTATVREVAGAMTIADPPGDMVAMTTEGRLAVVVVRDLAPVSDVRAQDPQSEGARLALAPVAGAWTIHRPSGARPVLRDDGTRTYANLANRRRAERVKTLRIWARRQQSVSVKKRCSACG